MWNGKYLWLYVNVMLFVGYFVHRLLCLDFVFCFFSLLWSPYDTFWKNPQTAGANLLRSIYVGGECNTDNDSNSIVQQSEYLQAVKRSIISPLSIDIMFCGCGATRRAFYYQSGN